MIDSATPIWPSTLSTPMLGRLHRFFPRPEVVQMESGRFRKRRIFLDSMELMEVQWSFTEDQFDAFELFFHEQLNNGSLSFVLTTAAAAEGRPPTEEDIVREVVFWEGTYSFSRSDNLFAVSATLEVIPQPEVEEDLCGVVYPNGTEGGGDTFDCYADSLHVRSLPPAGTGWDGGWRMANSPFHVHYDDFEEYADGAVSGTLSGGDDWDGNWSYAESVVDFVGDDFEDYAVGGNVGTMSLGDVSGWDGAWTHNASPETHLLICTPYGFSSSASTVTSLAVTVPVIGPHPLGSLVFLAIYHSTALTSDMTGWTLQGYEHNSDTVLDVICSVYTIPAADAPSSITLQQTAGRMMCLCGVVSPSGLGPVTVVDAETQEYDSPGVINPGLHPVADTVATADGQLGLHCSVCVISSTGTTVWSFDAGWETIAGQSNTYNRFGVAMRRVDTGYATGGAFGSHPISGTHVGSEVTLIFGE